jgi:tetratricopeptide (TPR) repeat protein
MSNDPRFDRLIAQGLEASRNDRMQEAIDFFAEAGALAPGSGVPDFLIGSEHAAAGDIDAAEQSFARALLLAPDFALARYQLGLLQFTSRRAAMALLTWQPLFALPAADPLAHFVRGFEALARDSFPEALAHYREGLACRDINQALAADVQRVVDAVEQLPGGEDPQPTQAHVLLSGYGKGLH